jgi:hypothetical protein
MPEVTFEDYNVYNMNEAHKYVSEVKDASVKRILELGLGGLLMSVIPFANNQVTPTRGFDALLFVQLNHDFFSTCKGEIAQALQGDVAALDDVF